MVGHRCKSRCTEVVDARGEINLTHENQPQEVVAQSGQRFDRRKYGARLI
jgi:hypothetical protein